MRHISNRFLAAVRLCTGPQTIKQRLTAAWLTELDQVRSEDLPAALIREFGALRDAMYVETPQPNESAPAASIRKMSVQQAADHTATILKLSNELIRAGLASSAIQVSKQENTELSFEANDIPARQLN